jgi:hypothetical protein
MCKWVDFQTYLTALKTQLRRWDAMVTSRLNGARARHVMAQQDNDARSD